MPERSLGECASQFATQWIDKERAMCAALAGDDRASQLAALQKGARHFRIARNFATRFDVAAKQERLELALANVMSMRETELSEAGLPSSIRTLSRQLAESYGGRQRLSAATKFLWLLKRDPVVIYDENARSALDAPAGDYSGYLESWFTGYQSRRDEIHALSEVLRNPSLNGENKHEWFRRRIYDIYLWNLGD